MTLSHQRLSMQLVLAAVRHLKSSMCFSALINQGIAETNLKTKNIHRVERKTISALQSCHFYRILMLRSSFAWRQHRAAQQWDCLCVDRARDVTAQPQGCAGRAKVALTPCHAQPRAMQHGAGTVKKQRPALCCLQVQTDLYLVKNLIHTFTEKNYRLFAMNRHLFQAKQEPPDSSPGCMGSAHVCAPSREEWCLPWACCGQAWAAFRVSVLLQR